MDEYEQLAKDLKTTANDSQFLEILQTSLLIEYDKGFTRGYTLAKELHNQGYIK